MEFDLQWNSFQKLEAEAELKIYTLGKFEVHINDNLIKYKDWGRDKTLQLFQYLIISRHHLGLHKEMIIDRLWEDAKNGESDFKVALHGINKVLEPNRNRGAEPKFVVRQGITYRLNFDNIFLDIEAMDQYIHLANACVKSKTKLAIECYEKAVELYEGPFLPDRIYEDWSSAERERLQLSAMNAHIALAELILEDRPNQSIELAQNVLRMDETWEDAHRLLMKAYFHKGNRPQAIRSYNNCKGILQDAFGIDPLPETKNLLEIIKSK